MERKSLIMKHVVLIWPHLAYQQYLLMYIYVAYRRNQLKIWRDDEICELTVANSELKAIAIVGNNALVIKGAEKGNLHSKQAQVNNLATDCHLRIFIGLSEGVDVISLESWEVQVLVRVIHMWDA